VLALSGAGVQCLQLVVLEANLLVLPATVPSGLWLCGILYFFLEARSPSHRRASLHFFPEIARLRFARDLGRGIERTSVRPPWL